MFHRVFHGTFDRTFHRTFHGTFDRMLHRTFHRTFDRMLHRTFDRTYDRMLHRTFDRMLDRMVDRMLHIMLHIMQPRVGQAKRLLHPLRRPPSILVMAAYCLWQSVIVMAVRQSGYYILYVVLPAIFFNILAYGSYWIDRAGPNRMFHRMLHRTFHRTFHQMLH